MGEKLEFKENELNEILESYETDIIERMNKVHNDLTIDIKKWEDKYNKEESRCSNLVIENQNLMSNLNKIESAYEASNDKYQQTCIKLNEAMKLNIEKDSEIDKLNLIIKDMNSDLTNSTSDSDVTNITNQNE